MVAYCSMKIGFLATYFYPVQGGAENNCFYLARELAKNHEVHVFTSDRKDSKVFPREETLNSIHIHRFKTLFRYRYYLALYPGIINAIRKANLDILHVHSLGFFQHDLAVLIKKLSKKTKLVITPHGPFMALDYYGLHERILKKAATIFEYPINKLYDAVIQVNPYQKEWMEELGFKESRIHFIPNGIPKEAFKKVPPLKQYKGKLIITYLGRIQEYKGLDQVIKVLPDFPKSLFIAMGEDAGDKPRLEQLAKQLKVEKQVIFTGRVSEKEKLQYLDASEIFILPSKWEAFGIALLEAMARGNAIISTETEGGKFLVQKENGFTYESGNLKQFKEKLSLLIQNKKLRKQMQPANKKKAKEFLWEKIAKQTEELYEDLLKVK